MKTKLITVSVTLIIIIIFQMYIIIDRCMHQNDEVLVSQPEYNHIVKIDTCRIVTDTLGKPFCVWYQDELYLPDPYQKSNQ